MLIWRKIQAASFEMSTAWKTPKNQMRLVDTDDRNFPFKYFEYWRHLLFSFLLH